MSEALALLEILAMFGPEPSVVFVNQAGVIRAELVAGEFRFGASYEATRPETDAESEAAFFKFLTAHLAQKVLDAHARKARAS